MRKTLVALAAAASIGAAALAAPSPAQARCFGCAVGAGVAGGFIAGAIIGSAAAAGLSRAGRGKRRGADRCGRGKGNEGLLHRRSPGRAVGKARSRQEFHGKVVQRLHADESN